MASTCERRLLAVEVTMSSTFNRKLAARSRSRVADQASWSLNLVKRVTNLCISILRKCLFGGDLSKTY